MPLSQEGQQRSLRENLLLAFSLAGVAGSVNAIGLIEVGALTSHLTGVATRIGTTLATSSWDAVRSVTALLFWFLAGAMTATLFITRARRLKPARYAAALLIEVFLLTAFTVVCEIYNPRPEWMVSPLVWTLCFVMGLQNALVTKISGAVVRTTHVTGLVTDLGIELVRVAVWFRHRLRRPGAIRALWSDPELYKVRLHTTILLSFISGAAMGASLVAFIGHAAMLGPVIVVTALVLYDRWLALHEHHEDEHPQEKPAAATFGGRDQIV